MKKSNIKSLIKEVIREIQGEDPMEKYKRHPLYKQVMTKQQKNKTVQTIIGKTVQNVTYDSYEGSIVVEFTDGTEIHVFSDGDDRLNVVVN